MTTTLASGRENLAHDFWLCVEPGCGDDDCWRWGGFVDSGGYGRTYWKGESWAAHRVAYELERGMIPAGLFLDHLCRNRACVNPDHLEPVSHQENMRRGARAQQTHCKNGHPFDEENTYRSKRSRHCRICQKARVQTFRERHP